MGVGDAYVSNIVLGIIFFLAIGLMLSLLLRCPDVCLRLQNWKVDKIS